MLKAEVIIALQKKIRETYTWEHMYKKWDISAEELQNKLHDTSSDESLKKDAPWLYDAIFLGINQKRAEFSPDFTKTQFNRFFDELNDLAMLQSTIDVLTTMFM
jgi:hypothetical protein